MHHPVLLYSWSQISQNCGYCWFTLPEQPVVSTVPSWLMLIGKQHLWRVSSEWSNKNFIEQIQIRLSTIIHGYGSPNYLLLTLKSLTLGSIVVQAVDQLYLHAVGSTLAPFPKAHLLQAFLLGNTSWTWRLSIFHSVAALYPLTPP